MDSVRFSMDSMRSATSPSGTPRNSGQHMGGFTDYRGSSLFSFGIPFSGPAGQSMPAAAKEEAAYGAGAAAGPAPADDNLARNNSGMY
jgi:hypothetical protein